jgi:spermidine synthase
MLPYHANARLEVGDALAYQRKETEEPFDCIFIDIFDANNLLPKGFYSTDFLIHLRDNILGPYGVVVHNFHSGGKKRALQIEKASAAYSDVFKTCCWVDSLDSRLNAGNALLLASKIELSEADISKLLTESAEVVQRKWGLRFDAVARARGARFIDVSASSRQQ